MMNINIFDYLLLSLVQICMYDDWLNKLFSLGLDNKTEKCIFDGSDREGLESRYAYLLAPSLLKKAKQR